MLGPRRLESAELGPRLGPQGVELCRREQDVALVHPSRHQDALLSWMIDMIDSTPLFSLFQTLSPLISAMRQAWSLRAWRISGSVLQSPLSLS